MDDQQHIDVLNFVHTSDKMSDQIGEFGVVMDHELLTEWFRQLEKVKGLVFTDPLGPLYTPNMITQAPLEEPERWRFRVGDEVERTDESEWLGMKQGDRSIVTEVCPVANKTWCQIRLAGYVGIYADFNFKLVRRPGAKSQG